MIQAGRIVNVHLPKDRVTQTHQGFGFVEFQTEEDADYASKIMNQIRLYGKPIRVNKASADKQKTVEVGAELFVGNLDPMVDEKTLYETFNRFGTLISVPKVCCLSLTAKAVLTVVQIARDDTNLSKGYGFVSFADFESSDEAIANMHGQYLMNKEITVQYAYKKDGRGERHGGEAERMLAAQAKKNNVQIPVQPLPPQLFAAPVIQPTPMQPAMGMAPPAGYGAPGAFGNGPTSQVPRPAPSSGPLPPPPAGLPARPPPSMHGFAPQPGMGPPGFHGPPPGGFPPPGAYPPGYGPPGQSGAPMQPPGYSFNTR